MLTVGQRRTYEFISSYFSEYGHAPTVAEIAAGTGLRSRGVVHRYLRALVTAGVIALIPNRHRNIHLTAKARENFSLPLVGRIAAGKPIEAIPQIETVDVASLFLGPRRYALRVVGDSMMDDGIFEGDIVVCERCETAENGQVVVALIDNHEATLKRFKREGSCVTLLPANTALQPMEYLASRVQIQGIYVGLLRI